MNRKLNPTLYEKALLILVQIFFFAADANEETKENTNLFFDKPIAKSMNIQFKIEEDLYPDRSTLIIEDFAFLSNEKGERAALVNLTNTAAAPHSLSPNQIYGLFADGTYRRLQIVLMAAKPFQSCFRLAFRKRL